MEKQYEESKGTIAPEDIKSIEGKNPLADFYANMSESTLFKSPQVYDSYKPPYNPDPVWQKYGDYRIYESMVDDDQVSVCLRLKKDLVLGDGGQIVPGGEGQEIITEDLETALFEDYEGDFIEDVEQILTGYEFGFSITEKIFKNREAGRLGLRYLRTRHPNSWRLHQDNKGAVEKYEQITVEGSKDINPKSITHYINDPRFQNPYGNSDLRSAYAAWFAKNEIVKFFAIFLEKAASPVPVATYDKNAPQSAVDKIFAVLKKFQTKTALAIPKDIEVEFLEAKNSGEAYVKAIHLFNMFIGRSLFIPDLVGFTGSETGGGSLALGKEQMNLFFMHIYRRRNALENLINKEFIWPMVIYNHGFIKNYPKFKFKPLDDMKAVELAKIWLEAVKGKTWDANPEEINHFRKLVKFPIGDVNKVQPAPNPLLGGMPGDGDSENPMNEKNPNDMKSKGDKDGKASDAKKADQEKEMPHDSEDDKGEPDNKKSNFAKAYNLPDGDYHKKVNFKAIETKLNDYDQSVMSDVRPVIRRMITDLLEQVDKKKILATQNTSRIDSLSLRYKKEIKQVLKNSFMQIYKDAQSQAQNELLKTATFAKKPVTSQKFLDIIEDETFKFVGDYEYGILKRVRTELIAAVKDGKALAAVEDVLTNDLERMSDVQIERFARTKHTEVLNRGRLDYFNDSEVVQGYQYSAILDDVTSEICSGLHGKKFKAGEEPVPPLHFNCRSLLIPITKYEEFKPTESIRGMSPDEFIEEHKGEGFSKFSREPKITDPGVEMSMDTLDEVTQVFTYAKDGKAFYKVTVTYEDETKKTQKSVKPERIPFE